VLIGGTVHDLLAAEFGHALLPDWGWNLVLLAGLAFVLHRGVQLSTRAQFGLAMVSLAVLTIFFGYVIVRSGSSAPSTRCRRRRSTPRTRPWCGTVVPQAGDSPGSQIRIIESWT
jgi:hypothetical protein